MRKLPIARRGKGSLLFLRPNSLPMRNIMPLVSGNRSIYAIFAPIFNLYTLRQ